MRSVARVLVGVVVTLLLVAVPACTSAGGPGPTPSPTTPVASPTTPTPPPTPEPTPAPPTSPAPAPPPEPSPPAPEPPSSGIPEALRGVDVERIPTEAKVVALTFDGGASAVGVGAILGTLADKGVRATFFLTGDFARRNPGAVAAMAAAGHRLGNHSDTHAHYPQLRNVEITADLARAEASIVQASGGATAKPLFRFPYGDRTPADIRAVNAAGYLPVRWTVDTLGWAGTERGVSADVVLQRILDTLRPGQIVLMHVGANPDDGSTFDADALPRIIDELRARGYSFVALDDALLR